MGGEKRRGGRKNGRILAWVLHGGSGLCKFAITRGLPRVLHLMPCERQRQYEALATATFGVRVGASALTQRCNSMLTHGKWFLFQRDSGVRWHWRHCWDLRPMEQGVLAVEVALRVECTFIATVAFHPLTLSS